MFQSDNDPYISMEKAQKLAKRLGIEVALIKDAGHFNAKAGYLKFEKLLKEINE